MIALVMVFLLFLIFFGFIGASRGWAKEVLVVASVILALAAITLLADLLNLDDLVNNATIWYWICMFILTIMVIFGYQSPKMQRIARATEKTRPDRREDPGFPDGHGQRIFRGRHLLVLFKRRQLSTDQ